MPRKHIQFFFKKKTNHRVRFLLFSLKVKNEQQRLCCVRGKIQFFLHHHDLQFCNHSFQERPEYQRLCSDINKTHLGFAHRHCCKVLQRVKLLTEKDCSPPPPPPAPGRGGHLKTWKVENKPKGWKGMAQYPESASYDLSRRFYVLAPIHVGTSPHLQTYLINRKDEMIFFF